MSNEAALIEAIRSNPHDHTLPLILADFFDENNDPRGQWIRDYHVREWMRPDYQSPVPKLLEALAKDKNVIAVRRAAAVIGEPLVPGLIELLKHEKPRARQQACHCLRTIGPRAKAAVPALIERLSDPEHWVREQAAKALKAIGGSESADTDKLKGALNNESGAVRRAASAVLGKMGARTGVIDEIVERFDSPDAADRVASVNALREIGTAEVVPHLAGRLCDGTTAVRVAAVHALGSLKLAGAVPALLRAFDDSDAEVRRDAVQQFNSYGRNDMHTDEAIAALAERVKDRSAEVRQWACIALQRAGKRGAAAEPALLKALGDESAEVRRHAAGAVGLACPTPAAAAALLPLLADPEPSVAGPAAQALAQCENLPRAFAEPILEYLRRARVADTVHTPVSNGLYALGRIADPPAAVLNDLRAALQTDNERWEAVHAVRLLGPAAEPLLPDLFGRFETGENAYDVLNAILAVGPVVHARLGAILDGPDAPVRGYLVGSLRYAEGAVLPLLPALTRLYRGAKEPNQRAMILNAICVVGPGAADAVPVLLDALLEHGSAQQNTAYRALLAMREALVPYVDRLAELAEHPKLSPWREAFAKLFADLATYTDTVVEPLRAMLRRPAPSGPNAHNERWQYHRSLTEALRGLMHLREAALPAVPDVLPLLAHENEDVRARAVTFFWFVEAPAAVPALCKALTDASDTVRAKAAEVLAKQGAPTEATLQALALAVEDRAVKVRRAAVETLNKLGASSPSVLVALEAATEDADAKVKARAGVALRKLTPKVEKPAAKPKPKKKPR